MKISVLCLLLLGLALSTGLAQTSDESVLSEPSEGRTIIEKPKIAITLGYGAYFPTDSTVQDTYDDAWTRWSIGTFEPVVPRKWRFIGEVGNLSFDGESDVRIIPVTVGLERGFADKRSFQPYLAVKAGPYFGKVKTPVSSDSEIGLSANVAYGVIYKRRYYLEARYDYLTEIADQDFSGFSISIGTKIFTIRL